MRRNAELRLLTLTEESNFNIRMAICPTCWTRPEFGDRVVVGKGAAHVCLECAEKIGALMRSRTARRCSRHGCSNTFDGRGRGQYCSNACRQAAYRHRASR